MCDVFLTLYDFTSIYTSADYVFHARKITRDTVWTISKFEIIFYFLAALPHGSHEFFQILSRVMFRRREPQYCLICTLPYLDHWTLWTR